MSALVTHFIAPSRCMRDRFVAFGVPADRILVSEYGVRSAGRRQPERSNRPGPLRLGFLGSLMVSKAPHLLLEAHALLPPGRVTVDVFGGAVAYHGDTSYRTCHGTTAGPAWRAAAHGPWPHERLAEALANLDVLVVPSIWQENSPFVIREAFAAGVPVVASRIGGIPETVQDGENGLLFEPGERGRSASRAHAAARRTWTAGASAQRASARADRSPRTSPACATSISTCRRKRHEYDPCDWPPSS